MLSARSFNVKRPENLSFLDDIASPPVTASPTADSLTAEAEMQLYLDVSPYFENPLDFYGAAQNRNRFRRLAALANQLLSAPAPTTGGERMFSICGILLGIRDYAPLIRILKFKYSAMLI